MSDVPHLGEESKTMTPADKAAALLDRLRALAQEATPGPWRVQVDSGHEMELGWSAVAPWHEADGVIDDGDLGGQSHACAKADAAHIAAANPAVVLALVEVLDRLLCPDGSCGCEGDHQTLAAAYDALEPEGGHG